MRHERPPPHIIRQQRVDKRVAKLAKRQTRRADKRQMKREPKGPPMKSPTYWVAPPAGARPCADPFPGYHTRPVDVAVFEQIEQVAKAVLELHSAMSQASPEYRWLATSMMTDEIGDVYRMIQADHLEFTARNIRDLSPLITITPVEGSPAA